MTDNTKPEALDLADWLEAVGGGPSAKRCAALLREQHARIAELESELEAVGAGGVSGPLVGRAAPPTAQAEGWQSIETAPKDGTEILLHAPACEHEGAPVQARTTYGHWCAPSDTPRIKYQDGFAPEPEWEDFEPFWASWDGGFTEEHPPTHWMPLPAAPGPADGESK